MTCGAIIGAAIGAAAGVQQQHTPPPAPMPELLCHCHYCQAEVRRSDKGECVRCGAPL
jgi:uncharacterized paraquat-inducible protein A